MLTKKGILIFIILFCAMFIVTAQNKEDIDDIRADYLVEMENKNRVGNVATDFNFLLKEGELSTLHTLKASYILVYFNDPDCDDCKLLKDNIINSKVLTKVIEDDKLKVLSVSVFGKTEEWEKQILPEKWLDACDENMSIIDDELYYLPKLPILYLMNCNHNVILKNTNIKDIEAVLRNM